MVIDHMQVQSSKEGCPPTPSLVSSLIEPEVHQGTSSKSSLLEIRSVTFTLARWRMELNTSSPCVLRCMDSTFIGLPPQPTPPQSYTTPSSHTQVSGKPRGVLGRQSQVEGRDSPAGPGNPLRWPHLSLFIYQARESSLVPAGFLTAQFLEKL